MPDGISPLHAAYHALYGNPDSHPFVVVSLFNKLDSWLCCRVPYGIGDCDKKMSSEREWRYCVYDQR